MRKKAFTLLEIVIVIIIIGVLSSLALPKLFSVIEQARIAEAWASIASIRSSMERYYLMNNGSYSGVTVGVDYGKGACGDSDWSVLDIEDPACSPNAHFGYRVVGSVSPTYHIYANRNIKDCPKCRDKYNMIMMYVRPTGIKTCGYGQYSKTYGPC